MIRMRMSQMFVPTLREVPSEAEIVSHQLMLRAGLMRKAVSGVYSYLPLGYRVVRKVEQIVREEMDRQGGQELLFPAIQSAEIWKQTGRWDDYGGEMFRLKDRGGREMCLGPTHEELTTITVRDEVRSYRQLPKLVYQIQTKYRDEIRPRFGVMRAREFIMKDLYSFDRDDAGLEESYWKMYEGYRRAFDRMGLHYRIVEADSGAIGGTQNHEFMVMSEVGEAGIVFCDACGYAANEERADAAVLPAPEPAVASTPGHLRTVLTPDIRTIDDLIGFLGVSPKQMVKTMIYVADGKPVAALIRGDRDVNEIKLRKALGCAALELASPETIEEVTGAPVGFAGPIGMKRKVMTVADPEVLHVVDGVVGANQADAHIVGVNCAADFTVDRVSDIHIVAAGDACPRCGLALEGARGIEVGHLFKLGTKYSSSLNARYLDETGQEQLMIMGSYGIGITRCVAAIIEEYHDEDGITWPMSVAPYHVVVLPLNTSEREQVEVAEKIYAELEALGVEVVLDDRDERPGVKFKDADLIGFPVKVTIGAKGLAQGKVEVGLRSGAPAAMVNLDETAAYVNALVRSQMSVLCK